MKFMTFLCKEMKSNCGGTLVSVGLFYLHLLSLSYIICFLIITFLMPIMI